MRKAQAAMEFLMTYGWAILVVLVAIAALAYFGVLNPGRFLPESCTIGPGLACSDFKVSGTTATIIVKNGMGSGLTGVSLNLTDTATYTCAAGSATTIADGAELTYTCTLGAPVAPAAKYKGTLTLGYMQEGSTLTHTKVGSITVKGE
jgi:hypothetical protein